MPDPVIHRDIKPDNFLIAQELHNLVLADFGIARAASDPTLTEIFEVVGTPYYRAPEVLHGARGTVESDVYGLGRLLEWLLTHEVSTDMRIRPVPRGADLDDEACSVLDGIIAKATQLSPGHRYSTVRALAEQLPDLWISIRPRPKPAPALTDTSATTVLPLALELARQNDQLGWRQLESQLRRSFVEGIHAWRKEYEPKWRNDKDREVAFATTDSLFSLASGRIIFSLAGAYSNNSALLDQRRIVEDLLAVPDWNLYGNTAVVQAPRSLVFLFHYLHGALCMNYRQHELALQLGEMTVRDQQRQERRPLWSERDLTGWPKLLGSNSRWAWEYLSSLRQRQPTIELFFALQHDFEVGIATYSMLFTLHELATDAAKSTPGQLAKPDEYRLDFSPLFLGAAPEIIEIAASNTFGNHQLVQRILERTGATEENVRKLWPGRQKIFARLSEQLFSRPDFFDAIPVGELAL